ncbi:hypothetical protein [Mangrovimonas sp. YM274]|uniref:hypothetical protein n=1 Tax=Mangrovimonas sp. YM274 TaxID=3070660 RepID=UPI0027DC9431|nr:hypothetical protein [Mangrovimonas sp. YM274]WMI67773.1 hypothetical protein RBH95_11545 [Mangrovimonas sp. YM274]
MNTTLLEQVAFDDVYGFINPLPLVLGLLGVTIDGLMVLSLLLIDRNTTKRLKEVT